VSGQKAVLRCLLVPVVVAALLPATAAAEVKTRIRADGTLEVYNDGATGVSTAGARALQLRPVPQPMWEEWIRTYAAAQGVDPRLVQAVMQAESAYNPRAVSRKGAIGLMQLMPATARELSVPDPYSPEQNIRGGVTYLRRMMDLFGGRLDHAVAAYNAGPGAVQRYGGIPPYAETQQYVQRVLGLYRGGGMLVGLSASGGPTKPHGLLQVWVPSQIQQTLGSSPQRAAPTTRPAVAPPVTVVAAIAQPGAGTPQVTAPANPAPVPAAAAAAPAESEATLAVLTAGGG
jgi:hypothetical protein